MPLASIREPAVAGSWYPATEAALGHAIDRCLAAAGPAAQLETVTAIVSPHAGLMYSGPVAAHAYRQLQGRRVDVTILVGPSHFVGFDGVAVFPSGAFRTPLGLLEVDQPCADALMSRLPEVHDVRSIHAREHSLEMQLVFLRRLLPDTKIVPVLMGWQTEETARSLGAALALAASGRRSLMVASTDLSHYHDAISAARLDAVGLQRALNNNPEHACGGGPTVAVMMAARELGARDAVVLHYGDSGDVSGDKSSVVGYLAAALGTRAAVSRTGAE
jgi:AmmeMemoRadiSam system protein B